MLNRIMLRAAIGVFGRWARYRVVQKTLIPVRYVEKDSRYSRPAAPPEASRLEVEMARELSAPDNKVLVGPSQWAFPTKKHRDLATPEKYPHLQDRAGFSIPEPSIVRGPLTPNAATEPVNMAARIVHAAWRRGAHDPSAKPREFPSVLPDCNTTPIVRGTPPARAEASMEKLKEWRRDFYDHPTARRDGD